jgi:hypothetical protein
VGNITNKACFEQMSSPADDFAAFSILLFRSQTENVAGSLTPTLQ